MNPKYISPQYDLLAFNCPHCGVYADQLHALADKRLQHFIHFNDDINQESVMGHPLTKTRDVRTTVCAHCENYVIWHIDTMIYPDASIAPPPTDDMPDKVKALYNEAASIVSKSPRASTALLRLAIQILCVHLGEKGKNINADIASLVKKGLHLHVQKSLDALRVIGNNAVHPGVIDVDDAEEGVKLFSLLNFIVEQMITKPKEIENLYASLPEGAKEHIDKRDES